ncbi:MAG: BMP family ABC transporter substrate-binding protein [Maledivibacter sp.]|jgi:basic membrane protein A|nr:BMP family ABC transporter substrate-binding protein [Maledivibacter sp.]
MKKFISLVICCTLFFTLALTGCGNSTNTDSKENVAKDGTESTEEKLKIVLLIPGLLGDKSFFDSANHGLDMVKEELGAETKVIEMGIDKTKWQPTLLDVSEQDWDIVISGGWEMTEMLNEAAEQFTDKKYINFDTSDGETPDNLYAMFYKTNEVSFLAGATAALVTTSDMPLVNPEKLIGFLGGMDNPGINDFLVGYIEGAKYVEPEIKVAVSYVGDFANPAKGKEMSISQYNAGVDIGFNVAGMTGLGQLDAAKEIDKYAIGVDSDQALLFKDTDIEKSQHIVTSALKKIDASILRAVKKYQEGTLEFGKYEVLGFKEGGIGIAKNEFYNDLLNDEMKKKVEEIEAKLTNGEIEVKTAFGLDTDQINEIRNSVKPQ